MEVSPFNSFYRETHFPEIAFPQLCSHQQPIAPGRRLAGRSNAWGCPGTRTGGQGRPEQEPAAPGASCALCLCTSLSLLVSALTNYLTQDFIHRLLG